jgi:hypothetical protein
VAKLRDRHGKKIRNVRSTPTTLPHMFEDAEHTCDDCPLSLRCLSGRLTAQRGTFLCYLCGYMYVEDWVETVAPLADGQMAPMVTSSKYKFKCELRPLTEASLRCADSGNTHLKLIGSSIHDPGPGARLRVEVCPRCLALERIKANDET